jgi:glycosyltransferase involved in cell wall biosynthesis
MGFFTRRVFVLVERMLALGTDRLLFQNAADIEECRRCGIAPERKLVWVGNGIQLGNFGATARAETERVRILCVARLEPVKNHRMLIGAVLLLRARGIEFDLQLVGDGVLRGELETIVREKQLAGSVHFLGYRNDCHGPSSRPQHRDVR